MTIALAAFDATGVRHYTRDWARKCFFRDASAARRTPGGGSPCRFVCCSAMLSAVLVSCWLAAGPCLAAGVIIDHHDATLVGMPLAAILNARNTLHVAYAHTSHGSQVTDGMTALDPFMDAGGLGLSYPPHTFAWARRAGRHGAGHRRLLRRGRSGQSRPPTWAAAREPTSTSSANADVNVVMWSWCGQADTTPAEHRPVPEPDERSGDRLPRRDVRLHDRARQRLLDHRQSLPAEPADPRLLRRQQQGPLRLRRHRELRPGRQLLRRQAGDRQLRLRQRRQRHAPTATGPSTGKTEHEQDVDWFDCSCAHSQSLNGNRKAYAAWSLWTSIAALRNPVPGDASLDTLVGRSRRLDPRRQLAAIVRGDLDRRRFQPRRRRRRPGRRHPRRPLANRAGRSRRRSPRRPKPLAGRSHCAGTERGGASRRALRHARPGTGGAATAPVYRPVRKHAGFTWFLQWLAVPRLLDLPCLNFEDQAAFGTEACPDLLEDRRRLGRRKDVDVDINWNPHWFGR